MDYILGALQKPYVAILDGVTSESYRPRNTQFLDSSAFQWVEVSDSLHMHLSESPLKIRYSLCLKLK